MSKKFTKVFLRKLAQAPSEHLKAMNEDEVANLIQQANYQYHTVGKPIMTDELYEVVKHHLSKLNPRHPILKNVGAAIQENDSRKEKLPYWMGSMDKIKSDTSTLSNFKAKHPGNYLVSDKLDGVSALFHVKNGQASLYSRGDGEYGQNITHLIPFVNGFPLAKKLEKHTELTVRGELIMTRDDFEQVKDQGMNARNMVAGLVNAKIPNLAISKRIGFVAYSLITPELAPSKQTDYLKKNGFNAVWCKTIGPNDLEFENLSELLLQRRADSKYEIDGIIVSHDEYHPIAKGKNPTYAFAFKSLLTQETAEVIVTNVEWNVSKDGFIKPVVEFDGVKLSGVVIKRATGFNADFIKANVIGPGARIVITRSGDVIPYIRSVLSPASSGKPQLPTKLKFKWNESKKDIYVEGETDDQKLKQLENFFSKIDIKGVGPATVKAFFSSGYTDISSIASLTENDINDIPGVKNKAVVLANIQQKLASLDCVTLMVASNMFGHGFGERKLKSIVSAIPRVMDNKYVPSMDELLAVDGVSKITAEKFIEGLHQYRLFMKTSNVDCVNNYQNTKKSPAPKKRASSQDGRLAASSKKAKGLDGQKIVFTGFRNKEWESMIEENGGKVSTTVSSKTTLLVTAQPVDVNDEGLSSKIRNAIEKGIKCMSKDEFEKKYIK